MTVQVFAIDVDGVEKYWTGKRVDGELELTAKRADAMKFPSRRVALMVSETHPELDRSDVWRLQKLDARCERME